MSTQPLQHTPKSGPVSEAGPRAGRHRLPWACLPVMLALGGLVLVLFGVSWWTLLTAILLLACPAVIVAGTYLSFQPLPQPEQKNNGENSGK
ncbi:hypothetical protein [Rhizobium bangladeshense]|uniref:hypothetical protein n=1 Tax=Rhizobium bangladeshense TaxID=1138189 RepID=UPI000ADDB25E|nr:hypothetical protein [Rhizobium bangladeshense]